MIADERKRGGWLTGWLILIAFLYALEIGIWLTANPSTFSDIERVAVPILTVVSIVTVGAVIALWFWRKLGFYLLVATAIPLVILNLLLGIQPLLSLFPLYSLSTSWMLLRPKWQYFY